MERVTRKMSKSARQYSHKLLEELHAPMKDKYSFIIKLVGSGAWNTIVKDDEGWWDLDYQILLTKKSKQFKENGLSHPTNIKEDFFNYFNEKFKGKNIVVQNSTTAITLINKANKYSIDLVIIKLYPDNHHIIRRNNNNKSGVNIYTWNELPKFNEAYNKFNTLDFEHKKDLIENHILPRKVKEKKKRK